MSSTLEELANKVKKDHAVSNLEGTKDSFNEPKLEETDVFEFPKTEEPTASITEEKGLVGKMNEMVSEEINQVDDEEETSEEKSDPDIDDDDDEDGMTMIIPDAPEPKPDSKVVKELENDKFEITDEQILENMTDMPQEEAVTKFAAIRAKVEKYRKDQIFMHKIPRDLANEKAMKFMKELSEEENVRYLKANPNLLVLSVNKENEKDLEFSEEDKEKMVKAKVIKLEVVETDKLMVSKKVRKIDKKNKLSIVQSMDRYMSQYSVPLPIMNDFVTFKGAQLIEINNLRVDRDSSLLEMTEKKANLVYKQLISGANLQKQDLSGKRKMSYMDFLKVFPIYDLDLAVYGVMVASSMEEMETEVPCESCGKRFNTKYNLKTLMTMNGLTDEFKERFNEILKNKSNTAHLQQMYKDNNQTYEVESPITKNIYVINHPSIGRTIGLYQHIDMESEIDTYFSAIYQFLEKVYVFDNENEDYIEVGADEYQEMFAAIRTLPQTELNLLGQFIAPMVYQPVFTLKSKCENCGFEMETTLSPNDLVFLTTQGSPTQIRL